MQIWAQEIKDFTVYHNNRQTHVQAILGANDNSKKRGKGFKILFPRNHPKPLPCPETRLQMKHGQRLLPILKQLGIYRKKNFANSRRYPISLTYRLPMG